MLPAEAVVVGMQVVEVASERMAGHIQEDTVHIAAEVVEAAHIALVAAAVVVEVVAGLVVGARPLLLAG